MRVLVITVCIACSLLPMGSGLASTSSPLMLHLGAPHEVSRGSEVRVEVTLTNNSNRVIALELTSPFCDYEVEVRDSSGGLVPDTDFKKSTDCEHRMSTGRDIITQLKPHESQKDSIPISAFSDMSKPGKYSVMVTWQAPKELGSVAVKSNAVTITVTP